MISHVGVDRTNASNTNSKNQHTIAFDVGLADDEDFAKQMTSGHATILIHPLHSIAHSLRYDLCTWGAWTPNGVDVSDAIIVLCVCLSNVTT